MDSVTLKAPAKVNLFLEVLGARKDGYHDIVTVFEKIDVCDTLIIRKRKKPGVAVSCDGGIPETENSAYRAAACILAHAAVTTGVSIKIEKRIPIAAGLGGGSSDAAATLIGVNKLYRLGLGRAALLKLARHLGADVPFFITGEAIALGTGKGDEVKRIAQRVPKMWHLIIFPGVKVLTKDIYGSLRLGLTKKRRDVTILLHALRTGDIRLMRKATHNRLEDPAFDRDPGLGALKSHLIRLGMQGALLSGSGPTLFSIMGTRKEAVVLREKIRKAVGRKAEGWRIFVAPTFAAGAAQ